MEKKDYYALKEIILGLNSAYQLHLQELNKLKELCEVDKKKVADFHFEVYKSDGKNPKLFCDYEPKQNKVQKLITDCSKKTGFYIYGRNRASLVTDHNQYYFYGYPHYPIHVKYNYGMDKAFYTQANAILDSEFSRSMKSKYIEKNHSDIDALLDIDTRYINFSIRSNSDIFQKSWMRYDCMDNTLLFLMNEGCLNNQLIEETLNLEFPSSELDSYHIRTINASKMAEKPIVLGYVDPVDRVKLAIVEEENQVVLSKTRSKF